MHVDDVDSVIPLCCEVHINLIKVIECTLLTFYAVHFLRFQIVVHLITRNRLHIYY